MANTSATYIEVKEFLDRMRTKLTLMGGQVLYDTRTKNKQFMLDMEWDRPDKKKEWLLKLVPIDYYEGPDTNEVPGAIKYGSSESGLKDTCVTSKCPF